MKRKPNTQVLASCDKRYVQPAQVQRCAAPTQLPRAPALLRKGLTSGDRPNQIDDILQPAITGNGLSAALFKQCRVLVLDIPRPDQHDAGGPAGQLFQFLMKIPAVVGREMMPGLM